MSNDSASIHNFPLLAICSVVFSKCPYEKANKIGALRALHRRSLRYFALVNFGLQTENYISIHCSMDVIYHAAAENLIQL
jgi:hypothetical protein